MTEIQKNQIISELAEALQYNDYDKFTSYFEEGAVLELPFGAAGGTSFKGLSEIKKQFETIASDPVTKGIHTEEVLAKSYHADPLTIVEYFTKGRSVKAGGAFHIQSAVAFIRFGESGIVYYKDIPNTEGLAKKAGVQSENED